MSIPIRRVRSLASEPRETPRPDTDPRGAAVQEKWHRPYQTLIHILKAPTLEEFASRAEGFQRAKERLEHYLRTHRQDPDKNGGRNFTNPDFEAAMVCLRKAAENALSRRRREWNLPPGALPMEFLDIIEFLMRLPYSAERT